jgi:hypothetical protein
MFMRGDYWTVSEAVEQAANIWFSKEILDVNASIGLSSKGFRHTKVSSTPANAPTSGKRFFFKERITPKKITIQIRDVHADDECDLDPLPGEGKADTRESRPEDVASRKREAEHRIHEIRDEAWLKLKNDMGSGKLRARAMPCRSTGPYHPNFADPIDLTPSFWEQKDLSESRLSKPLSLGISAGPHLVLISKEELWKYLHPEEQAIDSAPESSRHPGGRKPKYDWDTIEAKVYDLMDENGDFTPDDSEWNSQACLVKALQEFYQEKFGYDLGESTLKTKILNQKWLEIWRTTKSAARN